MNFNLLVSLSFMLSIIVSIHCGCTNNRTSVETTPLPKVGARIAPYLTGCQCCFKSGTLFWTFWRCASNYYINSNTCPTNTQSCQWCGGFMFLGMDLTRDSCCVVNGQRVPCTWR